MPSVLFTSFRCFIMFDVKLFVLLLYFTGISGWNTHYCDICLNHTLCRYNISGASESCERYDAAAALTEDDVTSIITKVNERRNFIAMGISSNPALPPAANMRRVSWSEELATSAQRWADQCDPQVNPDRKDNCRDLAEMQVGQTIASVAGWSPGLSVRAFVDTWFMQSMDYTGAAAYYNSSQDRGTDDFTQLIWAQTHSVGCGRVRFYIPNKEVVLERLVCNFAPRGNVHGSPVYTIGLTATQCGKGNGQDAKYQGLCHIKSIETTAHPLAVSSLLRILNLFNESDSKQELDPLQVNIKQDLLKINNKKSRRNQKTRHILNRTNIFKPSLHEVNPWNYMNLSRRHDQPPMHQQERGHSHLHHNHEHTPGYIPIATAYIPPDQDLRRHEIPQVMEDLRRHEIPQVMEDLRRHEIPQMMPSCTRQHQNPEAPVGCGVTPCLPERCTRVSPCAPVSCPPPPSVDVACDTPSPCNCEVPSTPKQSCCQVSCQQCVNPQNYPTTRCPRHFRRLNDPIEPPENKNPPYFQYSELFPNLPLDAQRSATKVGNRDPVTGSRMATDLWMINRGPESIKHQSNKFIKSHKQVKNIFHHLDTTSKLDDYYDSLYSSRRKREDLDGDTFKPFWQLEDNKKKMPRMKSLRYTTLKNVRNRKTKMSTAKHDRSTEPITIFPENKFDEMPNIEHRQGKSKEKLLSFDELMSLRRNSAAYYEGRRRGPENLRKDNSAVNIPSTTSKTEETNNLTGPVTVAIMIPRMNHCSRPLTCTWTVRTLPGGANVPGGGGGGGANTPPGYVEGCTRTATCTRDRMERNMITHQTVDDPLVLRSTEVDEDYCERRSLNGNKRDRKSNDEDDHTMQSQHIVEIYTEALEPTVPYESTKNQEPDEFTDSTIQTIGKVQEEECPCNVEQAKRNKIAKRSCAMQTSTPTNAEILTYGNLYYAVIQKLIKSWKNRDLEKNPKSCVCSSCKFSIHHTKLKVIIISIILIYISTFK